MTRSQRLRVYPCILYTLLRFAFASAPHCLLNLACKDNSPVHSTKGTPSHLNVLWLVVSIWFQDLFHSAPAVLFIFPSWYWFTIGHIGVFSLTGWSRWIPTRFHVPRCTQDSTKSCRNFNYRACTFFGWPFNAIRLSLQVLSRGPTTPDLVWFGLFQFRSPLLSESLLFSFPLGTKMFQFPRFSPLKLCIGFRVIPHYRYRVAPFGYPWIVVCLRLPKAFRRSLRPSSALYAKTSTIRSYLFNHLY